MGELTAVASAKRAVRGDLSDGAFTEGAEESSEEARGRVSMVKVGCFFWPSAGIASGQVFCCMMLRVLLR
jgi:hypothetical protein